MKIDIWVVVAFDTYVLSVKSYKHPNKSFREKFLVKNR